MIDEEILIHGAIEATSEVFTTMLDMNVRFAGVAGDRENADSGLISLVGITGDWGGSGVFCCSPRLACILCGRMLGSETDPENPVIDDEVLDVIAEITNMIIGNMKNSLEPITGPLAISVPTVIHGRNFQFRNAVGLKGASLRFDAEDEQFEVRIALAPVIHKPSGLPRSPVFGLAHVGLAD